MTKLIRANNASLRGTQAYSLHRLTLNVLLWYVYYFVTFYIVLTKIVISEKFKAFWLGLN